MGTPKFDQKSAEFNSSSNPIDGFPSDLHISASEERVGIFSSVLKFKVSNFGEHLVLFEENREGFKTLHHKSMELNSSSNSIIESPSVFQISAGEDKTGQNDYEGIVSCALKNGVASLGEHVDDDATSTSMDHEISDHKSIEFNSSSKPITEESSESANGCQISASEERDGIVSSALKIKIPSLGEQLDGDNEENNDGFKTPTSMDHKIPVILKCPPAPMKPKRPPSRKRRAFFNQKMVPDMSEQIELLFPPALLANLGGKIKKVRKVNLTNVA
ncbi:hypothetical protein Ancab_011645 [Ancistrocladus abbreviatus]